jgi:hypothetical protein
MGKIGSAYSILVGSWKERDRLGEDNNKMDLRQIRE